MSSKKVEIRRISKAELKFREAFERLKGGKPDILPKGTPLSQNNVAKEAGVDPSALRRIRFPELVAEIKDWVDAHKGDATQKSPRQMLLAQRSRNRGLQEQLVALTEQRDNALSQLIDAQARILDLMTINQRLQSQIPSSNVHQMSEPKRPHEK
jgi:hypothetical protein